MPTSVALSAHFESFVRDQVESGRYNNATEVVSAGLRLLEDEQNRLQHKNEAMRAAITAGINSGVSISAEDVFERLETKYKKQPNLKTDGN
jgi:antitoxin ParD1/3/4